MSRSARESRNDNKSLSNNDRDNSSSVSSWKSNTKVWFLGLIVGSWLILYLLKPSWILKRQRDGSENTDSEGNKVIDQQKLLLWSLGLGSGLWALLYGANFC